jgi:uncharacterized membrane protein YhaH (DUF805 family)
MHQVGISDFLRFFFTAGGRISRREYLLGLAVIYAVNAVLLAFALHQADRDLALGLAIMVSAFPSTVAQFVLVAKRCHDIGLSGAFVLVLLIPFVGLAWLTVLAAIAGNGGPNPYGAPPRFDPI